MSYVVIWTILYIATFVLRLGARISEVANNVDPPDFASSDRLIFLIMDIAAFTPIGGRVLGLW